MKGLKLVNISASPFYKAKTFLNLNHINPSATIADRFFVDV